MHRRLRSGRTQNEVRPQASLLSDTFAARCAMKSCNDGASASRSAGLLAKERRVSLRWPCSAFTDSQGKRRSTILSKC